MKGGTANFKNSQEQEQEISPAELKCSLVQWTIN